MRIAHVLFPAAFAGTERHVLGLCTELRARGHEAEVLCPPDQTEVIAAFTGAGIPTWRIAPTGRYGRFDVIHAHDGRGALFGRMLTARQPGARFVRTQHFVLPASQSRGRGLGDLSIVAHRAINHRLDAYVCVSHAGAVAARLRRDVAPRVPIEVIPPGVRLPSEETFAAARRRRADTPPTVVSAGRIEPERRLDILLEAAATVVSAIPDARLLIAGAGSAEAELKRQAQQLGLGDRITWTGWLDDVSDALAGGHVYVNTWPDEAFGMAMAEAMGFALPVIAPDSGSSPEVVADGHTGRLVPPLDAGALARALADLLSDPARAAGLGAAGRARSLESFSIEATGQRTAELYERLA